MNVFTKFNDNPFKSGGISPQTTNVNLKVAPEGKSKTCTLWKRHAVALNMMLTAWSRSVDDTIHPNERQAKAKT